MPTSAQMDSWSKNVAACEHIQISRGRWGESHIQLSYGISKQDIARAIRSSTEYNHCVYHCGQNVIRIQLYVNNFR